MSSATAPTPKPVQLQANLAGAWKTVLYFDAGDDAAAEKVQQGVVMLNEAAPDTAWRITTRGSLPEVLRHLSKGTYGIWMDKKHAS